MSHHDIDGTMILSGYSRGQFLPANHMDSPTRAASAFAYRFPRMQLRWR
jgi:hypothetical protein